MDLKNIPIFRMMADKMDWLAQRQRVLSQNVANADTPGYAARDIEPLDLREGRGSAFTTQLARTHPAHVQPGGTGGTARVREIVTYETAPGQNTVVLEQQMVKVAETQADHQLMTGLYRKHVQMLRIALGQGGGH